MAALGPQSCSPLRRGEARRPGSRPTSPLPPTAASPRDPGPSSSDGPNAADGAFSGVGVKLAGWRESEAALSVDNKNHRLRARGAEESARRARMSVAVVETLEKQLSKGLAEVQSIDAELAALTRAAESAGVGTSLTVPLETLPPFLPEERRQPPQSHVLTGEACGTGYEILLQGFNWDSHHEDWYHVLRREAPWFEEMGFTMIWLPPPTNSVSDEGYLPQDLYNLNSKYGSYDDLRSCVATLREHQLHVLGDVVLNHRCAANQSGDGTWNQFDCSQGKLDWGPEAIVKNDPNFKGEGAHSKHDIFHAAPNIDHSQPHVREGITEWLNWLKHVGYDGWRLDFVRGFCGSHVAEYMEATEPHFAVGEYWDSLSYRDGKPEHNQNSHRQRIVDWINAAGAKATAFDVTTKGILHAVFEHNEYWRLKDDQNKAPGVLGWWPQRATTFLENHDTGSSQGHWRFPENGLEAGYAYILTHPGTPTVFYDHLHDRHLQDKIRDLIHVRKRHSIGCTSELKILVADKKGYSALVDGQLCVRLGETSKWKPEGDGWEVATSGHLFKVWERS